MRLKFLLSTILLSTFVLVSFGQERNISPVKSKMYANPQNPHTRGTEIVYYPTFDDECSATVTIFEITDRWGFVSGTNEFGDKEKAQYLNFSGSAEFTVIGVAAFFAETGVVGNGEVTAKVYTVLVTPEVGPIELLGTSEPVSAADLVPPSDSSVALTLFTFAEDQVPLIEFNQFFASIDFSDLYSADDTAALYQTVDGCGNGIDTWEKWGDDRWFPVNDEDAWGLNCDFLITAIVEFDSITTSNQDIRHQGLQLYPVTPNPASVRTVLNYGLESDQPVDITIFDAQGKQVKQIKHALQNAGRHQEEIFTHDFAPGSYYYQIATRSGRLISTFIIQK